VKKILLLLILIVSCKKEDDNELLLDIVITNGPTYYFAGEINTDIMANCGIATPATTSSTNNTNFTITSTLPLKNSTEVLNLKFNYNMNQTQGAINAQQGFTITGGPNTIVGTQGTVEWPGGLGTLLTSCSGSQPVQYFDIDINLTGYYTPGVTTTVTPTTCKTTDNVFCNTSGTIDCYTIDNQTCMVNTATGNETPITVTGNIRCNHPGVITGCG